MNQIFCFLFSGAVIAVCATAFGAQVKFVNVAGKSGLAFRHANAASPEKFLIETMGAGAAWIDYDGDGWLDAYLVNGASTGAGRSDSPARSAMFGSHLFRNRGDGTFTDVTADAGVAAEGLYGMGAAVADYDNDGDQDLYVIGYGRSMLYRNEGGGKFADVTAEARTANAGKWGSSGAWLDYDRDGWLDLVIANYVDWTPGNNIFCGEPKPGYRAYCHPNKYKPLPATLLRNTGMGTFEDVSVKSGLASKPGNGLGVTAFDYNRDGWPDIFIANDSMANTLWTNRKNGRFEESALAAGVAFGENGETEAGMGVDAADFDGDLWPDLYVTHLDLELNRLYRHNGKDGFEDATFAAGLGYQTFHLSGFGVGMVDYDNDGRRDLFLVNGHVLDNVALFHAKTTHAEPKVVFRNLGSKFANVTASLGDDLAVPYVSRAAAFGDYDNDGDLDVLVNNNGQAAELLRNDGGNAGNWLQVRLIGTRSNRDGTGARITIASGAWKSGDERRSGSSYQSAHDPRVHFGLGERKVVDRVEIVWPSGTVDRVDNVRANQVIVVREGRGLERAVGQ